MIVWESLRRPEKHDVWVTEIRLRDVSAQRKGKVVRLLAKLHKEDVKEKL